MDNQVAINFLDQARKILLDDKSWLESTKQPINEAFDMATSALRGQDLQPACNELAKDTNVPCKDIISRQAAIDVVKGLPTWWADEGGYYGGAQPPMVALLDPEDAVSAIENLPSAQPEIIYCEECKHRDPEDKKCDCGHGIIWQLQRGDNWYCADAERIAK